MYEMNGINCNIVPNTNCIFNIFWQIWHLHQYTAVEVKLLQQNDKYKQFKLHYEQDVHDYKDHNLLDDPLECGHTL